MAESDCKFEFRVVEWQYTDKGSKTLRRLICKYQIGTRVNGCTGKEVKGAAGASHSERS